MNKHNSVVLTKCENQSQNARLIHMSRYLDLLGLEHDFESVSDVNNGWDEDAICALISKMASTSEYLNRVSEEHGVHNIVAPCSLNDIEDSANEPLVFGYLGINLKGMKAAFHELSWCIDDFNLPDALGDLEAITKGFIDD